MKSKLLATVVITAAGLVATPAGVGLAAMNHPPHAERLNAASTTTFRAAASTTTFRAAAYTTVDSYFAVALAFARFGPRAVTCAQAIAGRESGHWPYSDNGSHHGLFQLHNGFWGSVGAAAATLNRGASWYDPYVNAWAASLAFGQAHTFHRNWPRSVPRSCP